MHLLASGGLTWKQNKLHSGHIYLSVLLHYHVYICAAITAQYINLKHSLLVPTDTGSTKQLFKLMHLSACVDTDPGANYSQSAQASEGHNGCLA